MPKPSPTDDLTRRERQVMDALHRRGEATVAEILQDAGIPTVLFGPGGAGLHSIEEYVNLDDVETCASVLAGLAHLTQHLRLGGAEAVEPAAGVHPHRKGPAAAEELLERARERIGHRNRAAQAELRLHEQVGQHVLDQRRVVQDQPVPEAGVPVGDVVGPQLRRAGDEPAEGGEEGQEALTFVIQKHWATRLHYDFRLELDGVLLSWAVPKGPSLDPKTKRLAMHVEDHPIEYGTFEGVIPSGYGAGIVMLWDQGTWTPESEDVDAALKKGDLKFTLDGYKLKGSWVLVRTKGAPYGDGRSWLLIKHRDDWSGAIDITTFAPLSVKSEGDFADILASNDVHYHAPHKRPLQDVLTCIREKRTLATAGRLLTQNAELTGDSLDTERKQPKDTGVVQ